MQTYTTQMDAARKGIITPQMEIVAKKEYRTTEEIRQWVAEGKVAIPANKHHECLNPEGVGSIDLVAKDGDELVFVDVVAHRSTDGFPEAHIGRELREILAAKWLGEHVEEYDNVSVRFDDVAMMVVSESRALLRHHINCFGTMETAD